MQAKNTKNLRGGFQTVKLLPPAMRALITSNYWPIGSSFKIISIDHRLKYIELHSAYIFKNFANFATE